MRVVLRSRWTQNWSMPLLLAFLGVVLIGVDLLFVDTQVAKAAPMCTTNLTGGASNGGVPCHQDKFP